MPSSNCICSYQEKKNNKTQRHILEIHSLKQDYNYPLRKAESNEERKPIEKSYTDNNRTPAI